MSGRWTEGVRREVLPNGLTLLTQPVPGATAVAVLAHVRAGFFDEPDRLSGNSHVLEHMLFKGTPTRGVGQIAREMKAAGGYLNAGTGYDHTVYYAVLPPESLAAALDLQADALRRSVIDAAELSRELRVIIEEAKRKLDTPSAVAGETLHEVLFDQHRIRRWRIGTEALLAGFSQAEVIGYYRSRYVPSRTIIAMVGALNWERALDWARESFGGWKAAMPTVDPSPSEPLHREVRARTLRGDVRHAELAVGWRSVPALHPDAAALDVAAMVLSSGRASWLYRALRAPGRVTSVGATHFTPTEVGVFSVSADHDSANLAAAVDGIGECVARMGDPGPSEEELDRARTLLEARWARRLQTAEGRAVALAAAEALGSTDLLDEEFRRLQTVDAETIRRASTEWLRPDAVAGVSYLPVGAPEDLGVELLRHGFAPRAAALPSPLRVAALRLPPPIVVRGSQTGPVLHVELAGTDLLLARRDDSPLVALGIYRRRTVAELPKTAGLGTLAVRSAVRGAGDLNASALALVFERLGGAILPWAAADWFGFGTSVLAPHAVEGAALLELVLRAPALAPNEIGLERVTLAEEAAQAADDMVGYPMQLALRGAFGEQRYGLPVRGLPESIPALTDGMVRAWHACELAEGRTLLVAVGRLEPERLADQLGGLFESGPPRLTAALPPPARWPGPTRVRTDLVEERDKRQTAFATLFPGPSRGGPNRFAAEVWAAMASGMGGRLFAALRDERAMAYSVFASSWQRAGAGALLLYVATAPEREAEAREVLLAELARFGESSPEPMELWRAISYLTGQIPVRRQTAGAFAAEIADAWLIGNGLDEVLDPAAGYRAVNGEAIRRLSSDSLDPLRRVEGIVRGR